MWFRRLHHLAHGLCRDRWEHHYPRPRYLPVLGIEPLADPRMKWWRQLRFHRTRRALTAACIGWLMPLSMQGEPRWDGVFPQQEVAIDTLGGRLLVTTVRPGSDNDTEGWRLVEELKLGTVTGDRPQSFADIHDLTVDGSGRIYVLDVGSKEVRVFDRRGGFVRSVAPEGGGPGEWQYRRRANQQVVWQAPNRLWITDGRQRVILDTLGNELSRLASDRNYFRAGELPTSAKVIGADARGSVFARVDVIDIRGFGQSVVPQYTYVARLPVSAAHEVLPGDTLLIETRNITMSGGNPQSVGAGRGQLTLERPQGTATARFAWTVERDGTLWLVQRARYRFDKLTFKGDTIRTVRMGDAEPWPANESEFTPVIADLDSSPEGWLWVRREEAETEGATTWHVLDNCGRYRGTVTVPVRLRALHVGGGGEVYGVASDALDIDYVYRFRLVSTSGIPVSAETCSF